MPVFRKSTGPSTGGPAGPLHAVAPWSEAGLRSDDWADIEGLLATEAAASGPATGPLSGEPDPRAAVLAALAELRAGLVSPVLPAGRISDRLLDIWDLAHRVSAEAAAPAATLMTALLHRDLAGADEVTATCNEIEERLAAAVA